MDNSIKDSAAEKAVLGAVILDNSYLEKIDLAADEFYHEANKLIYQQVLDLWNAGKPIDVITLSDKLTELGKLNDCGGLEYLLYLMNSAARIESLAIEHAAIVKKKAQLRKIQLVMRQAESMCLTGSDPDDVMKLLSGLNIESSTEKQLINIMTAYKENTAELERKLKQPYIGVPTKILGLDKIIGGLQKSDLIILAARPAMGKTSLALNIATNCSIKYDKRVLLFSLEMGAGQLVNRIVASLGGIPDVHILRPKQLTTEEMDRYWGVASVIEGKQLDIYDSGNVSPSIIRKVLRRYKARGGVDVVMVDYLQLMACDGKYNGNKVQEVGEITRALKLLAREFDVPIILLSQLSRSVESRQIKRPQLADLRDSGTIEQDADIVLFLYREGYYDDKCPTPNTTELIIAKHRNGALGTVKLYFDGETTTFHDMLDEDE